MLPRAKHYRTGLVLDLTGGMLLVNHYLLVHNQPCPGLGYHSEFIVSLLVALESEVHYEPKSEP